MVGSRAPSTYSGWTLHDASVRGITIAMARHPTFPPLEGGVLQALSAVDSQLDRALQRTPGERETLGVSKEVPMAERVERVAAFIIDRIGDRSASLEALTVLAEAHVKALAMMADELGSEHLGKVRSSLLSHALDRMAADASRASGACRPADVN